MESLLYTLEREDSNNEALSQPIVLRLPTFILYLARPLSRHPAQKKNSNTTSNNRQDFYSFFFIPCCPFIAEFLPILLIAVLLRRGRRFDFRRDQLVVSASLTACGRIRERFIISAVLRLLPNTTILYLLLHRTLIGCVRPPFSLRLCVARERATKSNNTCGKTFFKVLHPILTVSSDSILPSKDAILLGQATNYRYIPTVVVVCTLYSMGRTS